MPRQATAENRRHRYSPLCQQSAHSWAQNVWVRPDFSLGMTDFTLNTKNTWKLNYLPLCPTTEPLRAQSGETKGRRVRNHRGAHVNGVWWKPGRVFKDHSGIQRHRGANSFFCWVLIIQTQDPVWGILLKAPSFEASQFQRRLLSILWTLNSDICKLLYPPIQSSSDAMLI